MMPAFSLASFADASLLYLLAHPVTAGVLTLCAVGIAAKFVALAGDARDDRAAQPLAPVVPIAEARERRRLHAIVEITNRKGAA